MTEIACSIFDSVTQIKEEDWNSVFGGDSPEGYRFFKTLEESRLEDFSFYYIVLLQKGSIVLIAPLFIADFSLDIAMQGAIAGLIQKARKIMPRFFILKTLFCGSPFGECGQLGIKKDIGDKAALIKELTRVMDKFCRAKNIPFAVFKDFLEKDTDILDSLQDEGFFKVESFPCAVTELNFKTLDEYINSLGQATRKSLRKKIKRAYALANISIKVADDADGIIDQVQALYENTYHSGTTRFEKLNREFFLNVARNLSPYVKFFLYYCDGKLGAFNLCFVSNDLFIDKFIGFDYEISNRFNLYFLSWCHNVEWCLKHSIRFYHSGQTDYYPKLRLGSRLVPLYAYARHSGPILNSLLKLLAQVLQPKNFDASIRNNSV